MEQSMSKTANGKGTAKAIVDDQECKRMKDGKLKNEIVQLISQCENNKGKIDLFNMNVEDDDVNEICNWVSKSNGKAKELDLSMNKLSSTGVSMLCKGLEPCTSIETINLRGNMIDDDCMISLQQLLKGNKPIKSLNISGNSAHPNHITDKGIEILSPGLIGNVAIRNLNLSYNKGITAASMALLEEICEKSSIEELSLDETSIGSKEALPVLLLKNGLKNGDLERIDFSWRGISDKEIIAISEIIKAYGCKKLVDINLIHNDITSKGASILFDALKNCSSLKILNLNNNPLNDDCMKSLGELLQSDQSIENIYIGDDFDVEGSITDKGIEILSEYLIGNTTLKSLCICGNSNITDASVPFFLEVANKTCINHINLWCTGVSETDQSEVETLCSKPIEEREIPIFSTTKSAAKSSRS